MLYPFENQAIITVCKNYIERSGDLKGYDRMLSTRKEILVRMGIQILEQRGTNFTMEGK